MKRVEDSLLATASELESRLAAHKIELTMGGEPTYVPESPEGQEWSVSAVGPTKLGFARALSEELFAGPMCGGVAIFSPGKLYPGETNPRWILHLMVNRDGSPIVRHAPKARNPPSEKCLLGVREGICKALGVPVSWLRGSDPNGRSSAVWILPLDHKGRRWISGKWKLKGNRKTVPLLAAEGPAGLRLPLDRLAPGELRRALVLEVRDGVLFVFLPPLLQVPFLRLLRVFDRIVGKQHGVRCQFQGYVPDDTAGIWMRMGLTADPGVLEVNLPPCPDWVTYRDWLRDLEIAAKAVGLRSWKVGFTGHESGTGGGNHLLFGGVNLDRNPFFVRPAWIARIIRYWQSHPSLSYVFTGAFVGPSSQAPRPDESSRDSCDLELAYAYLESLGPGDHRHLINETLRHMHIDSGGNTHRTEISFDKFWNPSTPGGANGLIEFRAIETFPKADWMAAVALLWRCCLVMLLDTPRLPRGLISHGGDLHDRYFLPSFLWEDLTLVLNDLRAHGFRLPSSVFREIWGWRFPRILSFEEAGSRLVVRGALEGWPLLCETPLEGGTTSRFVDTSITRIELSANAAFAERCRICVQGFQIPLLPMPEGKLGAGLRFRRTLLYPCLHPGIPPHLPLELSIASQRSRNSRRVFRMNPEETTFEPIPPVEAVYTPSQKKLRLRHPGSLGYDLRDTG